MFFLVFHKTMTEKDMQRSWRISSTWWLSVFLCFCISWIRKNNGSWWKSFAFGPGASLAFKPD